LKTARKPFSRKWGARVADSPLVLDGKTVFVSRARGESPELCRVLESQGVRLFAEPLLRFAPPEDTTVMDVALTKLGEFDWWLITSRNAVEFAASRSRTLGTSLRDLAGRVFVGAVGSATANAAQAAGLQIAYAAHQQSAAGLASELALRVAGKRVLLLRSSLADFSLPQTLAQGGAQVTDVVAYCTLGPDDATKARLLALPWDSVDAAIFFSPSAVRNLAEAIGPEQMKAATTSLCVAVGSTTGEAGRQIGFLRCIPAEEPSLEAIIAALHTGLAASGAPHKATGAKRT
jgi:uroporphyrinogen-III synthase